MVFCCIAIVGIAMVYFAFLSLRQIFSGPQRDYKNSSLPAPPRAVTGNGAQPVFGHTWLFRKVGGDMALEFSPDRHELTWLPRWISRPLRDCFSVFIWGQWRVVIRGPERVSRLMELAELKEDWAWSAPVSLLGCHCPSLLQQKEADFLKDMISYSLSHRNVVLMAPEFADTAEKILRDLGSGKQASKGSQWALRQKSKRVSENQGRKNTTGWTQDESEDKAFGRDQSLYDEVNEMEEGQSRSSGDTATETGHKIKFRALRSYTFDLIDGPILKFDRWPRQDEQPHEEGTKEFGQSDHDSEDDDDEGEVSRDRMLLWMDRLKRAMCVVKMTFGAEWMYIWLLSEYGRAVNARMKLQCLISSHVDERSKIVSENVKRSAGHAFFDPFAMPFPIVTMAQNLYSRSESVTGTHSSETREQSLRARTRSEPDLISMSVEGSSYMEAGSSTMSTQDTESPSVCFTESPLRASQRVTQEPGSSAMTSNMCRSSSKKLVSLDEDGTAEYRPSSCPDILIYEESPTRGQKSRGKSGDEGSPNGRRTRKPRPILDSILRRQDTNGNGLTNAATTDLSILLWMIMDAGNAWTAMALNLLALDPTACVRVQQELDSLVGLHGRENLFQAEVMEEMVFLDALLYESIRLCPPFLGGLKVTSHTVELPDAGVHIPKNTNVIFCQPTEDSFNLSRAVGKKPQDLGKQYPCPELFGFLPFRGQEVPIMVLQSKVFVAVLLQQFSPYLSKKRTFIRKIRTVFTIGSPNEEAALAEKSGRDCEDENNEVEVSSIYAESAVSDPASNGSTFDGKNSDPMIIQPCGHTTQTEAMKLFDKIPFPEPRRVICVRERQSALGILGVSKLGH